MSSDINQRIATRLRGLRKDRQFSLDTLAARAGVSRAMISLIERGQTSATAVVLEKLATAMELPLAALFDPPASASPLLRRADQPVWRDPASGYVRRTLSPAGAGHGVRIVEVEFPPGARVLYDSALRQQRIEQQIWMLEGRIDITLGSVTHKLEPGDCLAFALDQPNEFFNPHATLAHYVVFISPER